MLIIGISAYYHDSASCILRDGEIIYSLHEERLTRIKHDKEFPRESIKLGLEKNKITFDQIDYIVFFDKPFLKFERLLETYVYYSPFKGFESFKKSIPIWIKEKLFQKDLILKELSQILKNPGIEKLRKKLRVG